MGSEMCIRDRAGTGATTANLKGGLGSASLILDNGITVGAIVAVNSFGAVSNGKGEPFFASPFEISKEFGGIEGQVRHDPSILHLKLSSRNRENTTIANVAGVDLNEAVQRKYGTGCPGCSQYICRCSDDEKP